MHATVAVPDSANSCRIWARPILPGRFWDHHTGIRISQWMSKTRGAFVQSVAYLIESDDSIKRQHF